MFIRLQLTLFSLLVDFLWVDRFLAKLKGKKDLSNLGNDPKNLMKNFINSRKSFNIPKLYLHRYLRTTPVLAFLILVIVSILQFMGEGPYFRFTSHGALIDNCEKYWWSALIHIQNYYNPVEAVSISIGKFLNSSIGSFTKDVFMDYE
jgi:hypothetical protein